MSKLMMIVQIGFRKLVFNIIIRKVHASTSVQPTVEY